MERTTVIDMMADAMWTLAAYEAESEGLRKANVGSRCHQAGIVEGYTRVLAAMYGEARGDSEFFHTLIQHAVRATLADMIENPAESAEEARKRVAAGMQSGVLYYV
jgi:hypothetical protein